MDEAEVHPGHAIGIKKVNRPEGLGQERSYDLRKSGFFQFRKYLFPYSAYSSFEFDTIITSMWI